MIRSILEHTPLWVWALLCALVALGVVQTRTREVSKTRVTILPMAMIALSLSGVLSAFSPWLPALAAWAAGFCGVLVFGTPVLAIRGASWSAQTRRLRVPGSFLPVSLILGLFVTKYVAAVALALHPQLAAEGAVAIPLGLVYGVFAGLFWARARSLRALAVPA